MEKIKCILLADDDDDDIFLFREVISMTAIKPIIIIAKNGIEFMRLIDQRTKIDLVLLDINMPLKNGLECLEELNAKQCAKDLQIICLSTSTNIALVKQVKHLGAVGYISKPSSFIVYQQIVEELMALINNERRITEFYCFLEK